MALIKRHSSVADKIPTSSMADIAFLLLIFFLVTTVFPKNMGLPLVLPQGEHPVNESNVLHLLVEPSGMVGIRWGESDQTQHIQSREVAALWRGEAARNPNLIAAVRTDPDAAYGMMIDVLDQLKEAGAQRVSLTSAVEER